MAIKDALLPEFDHEMATTRRLLERVPLAEGSWKPHEKSFSLAALAGHLANIPSWARLTLGSDSLDMEANDLPKRVPHTATEALLAEFDGNVATARSMIAAADDAAMLRPWSLRSGAKVHLTLPKVGVLRSFVLNHSVHHRGQLSVYLRLRNVPVPAIYGPSADEAS